MRILSTGTMWLILRHRKQPDEQDEKMKRWWMMVKRAASAAAHTCCVTWSVFECWQDSALFSTGRLWPFSTQEHAFTNISAHITFTYNSLRFTEGTDTREALKHIQLLFLFTQIIYIMITGADYALIKTLCYELKTLSHSAWFIK